MKLEASDIELDALDAMSDADLTKTVRDHLAAHRASRANDDLEPSTPSKGGRSDSTLETAASKAGNRSANDRALARAAARNPKLTPADRAAARLRANDYEAESARDKAAAVLIKGYDRL